MHDQVAGKELTYIAAVAEAQRWALKNFPEVVIYGEDVGKPGGPYGSARNLQRDFGDDRVFDTPISETAMLGMAVGAAMRGLRPVVEIMFADFFLVAMDPVVNQAANVRYVNEGRYRAPITVRTQQGAMPGSCAQHSQNLEALFAHIPGLRVVLPGTPQDAYDLLRCAIATSDPVIVIENRALYAMKSTVILDGPLPTLGKAVVVKPGSDVTILSWSKMLHEAVAAAELLSQRGVSAEVIDLRWAAPVDYETILESVAKTGRLVIAHEANVTGGLGGEIAATVVADGFELLNAPIRRIGVNDLRIPAAPHLQRAAIPDRARIADGAADLCREWD